MATNYDVIVVGARCAGSPTAMLLARKGYRVLVVDRASFPSDTMSTHVLHPNAVDALARWGLLRRLVATGCPPIDTYVFDFGFATINGAPGTPESPIAFCPRRTVLDKLLVDAAADAGAAVREGFTIDAVLRDGKRVTGIRGHFKDGPKLDALAPIVIGADGRHSAIAHAVGAEHYREQPPLLALHYAYWSNLPMHGRFHTYIRDRGGFAAMPTNDDLTVVVSGFPLADLENHDYDLETSYMRGLQDAPEFLDRLRDAKRESKIVSGRIPNFYRRPFGPGWALVGDAGYIKDPITALGISDAFRDAELLATAVDDALTGRRPYDTAMGIYQASRDAASLPFFEMTLEIASMKPLEPQFQQLLGAMVGNQQAMDDFCRMQAGGLSPKLFFSDENIGNIVAAASERAAAPSVASSASAGPGSPA